MSDAFPKWLERRMAEHDLNNIGLARLMKISDVTVGFWLRGIRAPDRVNIENLARFFGVSKSEIYAMLDRVESPLPGSGLSPIEMELLKEFRLVPDEWKAAALDEVSRLRNILDRQARIIGGDVDQEDNEEQPKATDQVA